MSEKQTVKKMVDEMEEPRTDLPPDPGAATETEPGKDVARDLQGRTFDPRLHEVELNGTPRVTPRGNLRLKRGMAKIKSTIGTPAGDIPTGVEGVLPEQAYQATGIATAQIIFVSAQAVGGAEWKPSKEEQDYMAYAWANYYQVKGIKDLPPGVIVATAILSYAGPRFAKPVTQKKTQRAVAWMKDKIRKWRGIREPEPEVEVAADAS